MVVTCDYTISVWLCKLKWRIQILICHNCIIYLSTSVLIRAMHERRTKLSNAQTNKRAQPLSMNTSINVNNFCLPQSIRKPLYFVEKLRDWIFLIIKREIIPFLSFQITQTRGNQNKCIKERCTFELPVK